MNKCLFLVSFLTVVAGRPQSNSQEDSSIIEIEKQPLIELKTPEAQEEKNTKEILEKIALVNKEHGLKQKTKQYYHPFDYYYRSTNENSRSGTDLKSSLESIGSTPILEQVNYPDSVPPGHYIKRKIIHQQYTMVPNPAFMIPPQDNTIYLPPETQTVDKVKNIIGNTYYPLAYQTAPLTRQSWQWPLGSYFPIVIKDPFLHMINAVTTMIEYGPSASGQSDSCRKQEKEKMKTQSRSLLTKDESRLNFTIANNGEGAEVTVTDEDNPNYPTIVDIEDLHISSNPDDPVELNVNFRQSKGKALKEQKKNTQSELFTHPLIQNVHVVKEDLDSSEESDEKSTSSSEELDESEKAENVPQDEHKKFFSKDNTGSGIFVHKIKVRKGGVAIAGPGGIATAGSGGTAIVGPNGYAYTQPDSLAIAGSGTKVVAVEPTVNLAALVANSTSLKRQNGQIPRGAKIVAVGPVIYYNRG